MEIGNLVRKKEELKANILRSQATINSLKNGKQETYIDGTTTLDEIKKEERLLNYFMQQLDTVDLEIGKISKEVIHESNKENQDLKNQEARKLAQDKKAEFDRLRKMYKAAPLFQRIVNRANSNTPNWKQIKHYSLEELQFLERIRHGSTSLQEHKEKSIETSMEEKKAKFKEIKAKINNSRWNSFCTALNSKDNLISRMENEEMEEGKNYGSR